MWHVRRTEGFNYSMYWYYSCYIVNVYAFSYLCFSASRSGCRTSEWNGMILSAGACCSSVSSDLFTPEVWTESPVRTVSASDLSDHQKKVLIKVGTHKTTLICMTVEMNICWQVFQCSFFLRQKFFNIPLKINKLWLTHHYGYCQSFTFIISCIFTDVFTDLWVGLSGEAALKGTISSSKTAISIPHWPAWREKKEGMSDAEENILSWPNWTPC